jgi:hypothetical protein
MNELNSAKQELKQSKIKFNENRTIKYIEMKGIIDGKEVPMGYMKLSPTFIERIKKGIIGHY